MTGAHPSWALVTLLSGLVGLLANGIIMTHSSTPPKTYHIPEFKKRWSFIGVLTLTGIVCGNYPFIALVWGLAVHGLPYLKQDD